MRGGANLFKLPSWKKPGATRKSSDAIKQSCELLTSRDAGNTSGGASGVVRRPRLLDRSPAKLWKTTFFPGGTPPPGRQPSLSPFGSELAAEQGRTVEGLVGEKQSQMGFKSSPAKFPGSKMQLMRLTLKFQAYLRLFSDTLSRTAGTPDERFCRRCSVKRCGCNLHLFIYIFTR